MIYQPKIAYFPLRKAFEKQTEVIEDQGEKQVKSIEEYGKQAAETNAHVKKDNFGTFGSKKDSLLFLREKEIFNEFKRYKI